MVFMVFDLLPDVYAPCFSLLREEKRRCDFSHVQWWKIGQVLLISRRRTGGGGRGWDKGTDGRRRRVEEGREEGARVRMWGRAEMLSRAVWCKVCLGICALMRLARVEAVRACAGRWRGMAGLDRRVVCVGGVASVCDSKRQ